MTVSNDIAKYRGFTFTKQEVKGYYCEWQNRCFIAPDPHESGFTGGKVLMYDIAGFIEVSPESVGQFTGKKDKNGKEIYGGFDNKGGDICKWKNQIGKKEYQGSIWLIIWDKVHAKFTAKYKGGGKSSDSIFPLFTETDLEVIGNATEHPSLLKGEQE